MITTKVFSLNLKSYSNGASLIINQGGTSSSKSYSILQLLVIIAQASKERLIISIVSYALPHLKLGVIRDFESILLNYGIEVDEVKNKTDINYKIGKSIIEFFSTDNIAKVHGPRRDILFMNECNLNKFDIYTQLAIRTKKCIFLDYNPTREFWVHTDVIPKEKHTFIKSTYLDNCMLDTNIVAKIESRKSNLNWWKVYGLGEVGTLEGAILTNWSYGEFDDTLPFCYGMDFGVKHYDALVKCAVDKSNKIIYWHEEIYQNGLSTEQLGKITLERVQKNKRINGDSSALRTINDLKKLGLNIHSISKNKIVDDIKTLLGYKIIISHESYNLAKNLNNWLWIDKKGELPMDIEDDLIDAGRYGTMPLIETKIRTGHKVLN